MTTVDGTRTSSHAATAPASLAGVFIEHFTLSTALSNRALNISQEQLTEFGFTPNAEVTLMFRHGELVLTSNPTKRALLQSAEELLYRQDETKQDHTSGIIALLNTANALPPTE